MLNDVITIIFISTLPCITGWYLGAMCQRRADERETVRLKERHRKELQNAFSEQAIVSDQFFSANQSQWVTQKRKIGDVVAANSHAVGLIVDELKNADLDLKEVFSVLEEARGNRNRMMKSAFLVHRKFDRIEGSIPSYQESGEWLRRVFALLGEIEEKSVRVRSMAAEANLLAANASLEAARAGEPGRSFAAFADCMQALSSKSTGVIMEIYGSVDKTRLELESIIQQSEHHGESLKEHASDVLAGFNEFEKNLARFDEIASGSNSNLDRGRKMIQELQHKVHALADSLSNGLSDVLDEAEFETCEKSAGGCDPGS